MSTWSFIEASNGLVLKLTNGGIVLSRRSQVDSKLWRLDAGLIRSKTGSVVDIPNSNRRRGVGLKGWRNAHGGANQKFTYDGSAIRSDLHGFVFDVEGGVMEVGSAILMWPYHGGDNQIFKFVQVSTERGSRNRRAFSDKVEVKVSAMQAGIPRGWRQANLKEAEAHKEAIVAQMGKWWIAEVAGGWINGRGYGGNVEARGKRALGHRVLIRRVPQRLTRAQPLTQASNQGRDGAQITRKEMEDVVRAVEALESGNVERKGEVENMTKESSAAIEKKIEARAEIFEEKTLDLSAKVDRMKTVKATIEQSLDSKESELKRKSAELKKLKEQLENALTALRIRKRELSYLERGLEGKEEDEASSIFSHLIRSSWTSASNTLDLGSADSEGVSDSDVSAARENVKVAQREATAAQQIVTQRQGEKDRLGEEVASLHRSLSELEEELLPLEEELRSADVEVKKCDDAVTAIRAMLSKANAEDMAVPLPELLVILENNQEMLEEEAKVELEKARVKLNALNLA